MAEPSRVGAFRVSFITGGKSPASDTPHQAGAWNGYLRESPLVVRSTAFVTVRRKVSNSSSEMRPAAA
jgi:hypothetical protein